MSQTIVFEFDYCPDEMTVEKDAKIFEVGDYPDKEITVSEADLDAIVENFAEVPVKIEHEDSPLDPLGTVKRIWRQGKELFARLAFPRDLASFLERRGIKRLSVALHQDPLRLAEVSLVLSPRVADAALFGENPKSEIRNPKQEEEVNEDMTDQEKDAQITELKFALRVKDVEARLAELKAQGKIVPASEPHAREILLQGDGKITFGDEEVSISRMFERFLEAQPKVVVFGELAPGSRLPETPLSAEEEELLAKLGLSKEQFAKYAGA
ncbi:MAG TPA: hypothetical protein VFI02_00420 [Armatimonadota bacterium]|nr:hypothetical protein [Armatimonadota bacterium]